MNISLLIIAGGKSSRFGVDKRFVEVGGVGMLENILQKASANDFTEIFLCVEEDLPALKILSQRYGAKLLIDEIQDAGAMAGLAVGLRQIKTDWALAVSTDMPFFDFEILRPLMNDLSSAQAIIPEVGGHRQMLAAFYRREVAGIFSSELANGQRKIFAAIKKIPHIVKSISGEEKFFNVNTRADLRLARGRSENLKRKTPIISIVAPESGTGKTTFIERLIKIFTAQGIKIGVIKSDMHGFNLDVEGKDSWRFQNAGAKSVAVVSPKSWFMIQQTDERENFLSIADKMAGVDLILMESRTQKIFPTISLWRGIGEKIIDDRVCVLFTSAPEEDSEILQCDINDLKTSAQICKFLAGLKGDTRL